MVIWNFIFQMHMVICTKASYRPRNK
uniref:Uncharacterized protein n=1 Tax=Arundo donax TaxID=35708 RepID=A0A0A9ARU5_ARUDO